MNIWPVKELMQEYCKRNVAEIQVEYIFELKVLSSCNDVYIV